MFGIAWKPQPERDWYWSASAEDRKEYDAFGPWVDAVRNEAEMPPRFRAAYQAHRDARFLLKVPIGADRNQVRPGMSLYRSVLAVHDDRLSLLRLVGGAIVTRSIAWSEVAAIRSMTNLLRASWSLLLKDGDAVSIDYNAVSTRRFDALTDFVRGKLTPGAARLNDTPAGASPAIADHFFQNMMAALIHGGTPAAPLHFEPRDRPCRDERNRHRLSTGLLILAASDELIVVDRGLAARRYFHPTYAARLTFVPYQTMSRFALAPPGGKLGFHILSLGLGRQVIVQPCLAAPDRVVAYLLEHGIPQVAGQSPSLSSP